MCLNVIYGLDSLKGGFKFKRLTWAFMFKVTRTEHNKSKSAHFETPNAHPIQYGAGLTDGPSVFKAWGADLISKQVKPKRGRTRDNPYVGTRAEVLPAPPQLGPTSPPASPLLLLSGHLFLLPGGVRAASSQTL